VRRYEILDRDFSPEQNEVTPTLKLKRRVVEQNFASELEALYTD
jgi:long-chain acyl-CoA synthetase